MTTTTTELDSLHDAVLIAAAERGWPRLQALPGLALGPTPGLWKTHLAALPPAALRRLWEALLRGPARPKRPRPATVRPSTSTSTGGVDDRAERPRVPRAAR